MKKGFKFVETIQFECKGTKCITPCPHNQQTYLGVRYVGSSGCVFCEYYTSRTAKTVNCMYKYKNKPTDEAPASPSV